MIEWLIGILFAYLWVYKRKPKSHEQNLGKDEPLGTTDQNATPFDYLKNDETVRDLI